MRKVLSLLLVIIIALSGLSVSAFAVENENIRIDDQDKYADFLNQSDESIADYAIDDQKTDEECFDDRLFVVAKSGVSAFDKKKYTVDNNEYRVVSSYKAGDRKLYHNAYVLLFDLHDSETLLKICDVVKNDTDVVLSSVIYKKHVDDREQDEVLSVSDDHKVFMTVFEESAAFSGSETPEESVTVTESAASPESAAPRDENEVKPSQEIDNGVKHVSKANDNYPEITNLENIVSGVRLTFTSYKGAAKYRLFIKSGTSWKGIGDTKDTVFIYTAAKADTRYTFTVRALDKNGKFASKFNSEGWTTTFYGAPVISKIENVNRGVSISWKRSGNIRTYRIYRKTTGNWTKLMDVSDTLSFIDNYVDSGVKYTYTVRGISDDISQFLTGYTSGKSITFIKPPVLNEVDNNNNGAVISWKKSSGAAKYRVFYKTGTSGWKKLADTTSLSYSHKDPAYNKKYTYTVRCITSDGSSFTSGYDMSGVDNTLLAAPKPSVNHIKTYADMVKISWSKVSGAKMYRVYYKGGDVKSWKKLDDIDINTYELGAAHFKNGTTYSFTVRCISQDCKKFMSGYSSSGVSLKFYETPFIQYTENTSKGIYIGWNKVSGVSKYRVFIMQNGSWKKICDISDTGVTITGLEYAGYMFTVRGLDSKGNFITAYDNAGFRADYSTSIWLDPPGGRSYAYSMLCDRLKYAIVSLGFVSANTQLDPDDGVYLFLGYSGSYGNNYSGYMIGDCIKGNAERMLMSYKESLKEYGFNLNDCEFELVFIGEDGEDYKNDETDFEVLFHLVEKDI